MSEHIGMPIFSNIVATIFLATVLSRLVVIDLRTGRLPDIYTLPLIIAGLALNAYWQGGLPTFQVWGAIIGYVVFWIIGTLYHRFRGVDGLGLGDAKLLAAAGAWLGIDALPIIVLIASVGGLVFARVTGLAARERFSFGPWLAAAFFLIWLLRYI